MSEPTGLDRRHALLHLSWMASSQHWRHWLVVSLFGCGLQVPALAALGHVTGHPGWVVLAAALLTAPFLSGLGNPWELRPRSRLHLYGLLWPFFAWWSICVVFLLLAVLALPLAALAIVTLKQALTAALVLALLGGLRALSRRPRIIRQEIPIADLPRAFDGYRIVQLSDIHCGPFTPARRVDRWVDRANRLGADLAVVTGDLITSGRDYTQAVAECLSQLRAPDGVYGCMGNHDYFTDGEAFVRTLESNGLTLLRNRGLKLERDGQAIYLAGVDDTWTGRANLAHALHDREPETPVVLLAHDPALFARAAKHDVALTLSGHTHGGQVAFPLAPRRWNLARFMTPFTTGCYQIGPSFLYVNRGLGTTGPPVRLGVRPEITVFTLIPAQREAGEDLSIKLQHLAEDVIREVSVPPNPLAG
jgi:predicted MPP superfamily phosphohydrolase